MKTAAATIGRIQIQIAAGRFSQAAPFAAKTSNRAAVHGAKEPQTHTLDNKEKVEKEIKKGKEEKDKKRQEVEDTVNARPNDPDKSPTVSDSPGYTASS